MCNRRREGTLVCVIITGIMFFFIIISYHLSSFGCFPSIVLIIFFLSLSPPLLHSFSLSFHTHFCLRPPHRHPLLDHYPHLLFLFLIILPFVLLHIIIIILILTIHHHHHHHTLPPPIRHQIEDENTSSGKFANSKFFTSMVLKQ